MGFNGQRQTLGLESLGNSELEQNQEAERYLSANLKQETGNYHVIRRGVHFSPIYFCLLLHFPSFISLTA